MKEEENEKEKAKKGDKYQRGVAAWRGDEKGVGKAGVTCRRTAAEKQGHSVSIVILLIKNENINGWQWRRRLSAEAVFGGMACYSLLLISIAMAASSIEGKGLLA